MLNDHPTRLNGEHIKPRRQGSNVYGFDIAHKKAFLDQPAGGIPNAQVQVGFAVPFDIYNPNSNWE
ncbi:MAG: hypothetical protein ABIQ93_08180 [Saprospiraceae bacterium]